MIWYLGCYNALILNISAALNAPILYMNRYLKPKEIYTFGWILVSGLRSILERIQTLSFDP